MLDNTIFTWGSGLGDGNNHTNRSIPTIVAGRGGGTIRTGRHVPKCSGNQGESRFALAGGQRAGTIGTRPWLMCIHRN